MITPSLYLILFQVVTFFYKQTIKHLQKASKHAPCQQGMDPSIMSLLNLPYFAFTEKSTSKSERNTVLRYDIAPSPALRASALIILGRAHMAIDIICPLAVIWPWDTTGTSCNIEADRLNIL